MRSNHIDCKEARARLHAHLDRELDLPGSVEVDRHVASCEACRALFEEASALQSSVRRHAQYHAAPGGLAERIRAQLGASQEARVEAPSTARAAPRRFALPRWLELGAVAAAAAVVSWIGALQFAATSGTETLADQVIAGHARAVLTSHVVDVETSDQHTVKPWLSGKLDFSPRVVDLAEAGFPLAGGRLDYLDGRPVATLVYRSRQHVIDLYVWPDRGSASAAAPRQALSKHGYNVLHWRDDGMEYWAISDLNAAELETFARSYSSAP
ncbi:MAG TPA: anti-sigma factor [Gammaproteobacteria bacterium]|nr:anti-sigma factor [Gammaproteobacteria bacterium]